MDWIGAAASAIGTIGGIFSQNAALKAAREQANAIREASALQYRAQMEIAQPMLNASRYALPKIQSEADRLYGTMFQDNPLLASQQRLSEAGVNRGLASANQATGFRYGSNVSRSRGETLRNSLAANDQLSSLRLNYGLAQQQQKLTAQGNYMSALSGLAGQGTVGSQLAYGALNNQSQSAMQAAGIEGQAKQDMYSGLGYLSGQLTNWGVNSMQQSALNRQNAKTTKTSNSAGAQDLNNIANANGIPIWKINNPVGLNLGNGNGGLNYMNYVPSRDDHNFRKYSPNWDSIFSSLTGAKR